MTEAGTLPPPVLVERHKGITRNEPNKCWLARIRRRRWNYSQYFWDGQLGGREAALAAAKAWYAEKLATLPAPVSSRGRITSRNKSGVVGVNLGHLSNGRGYRIPQGAWVARWISNRNGKRFSIPKYGDEQAFLLACVARALESTDDARIRAECARWRADGRALVPLERLKALRARQACLLGPRDSRRPARNEASHAFQR